MKDQETFRDGLTEVNSEKHEEKREQKLKIYEQIIETLKKHSTFQNVHNDDIDVVFPRVNKILDEIVDILFTLSEKRDEFKSEIRNMIKDTFDENQSRSIEDIKLYWNNLLSYMEIKLDEVKNLIP